MWTSKQYGITDININNINNIIKSVTYINIPNIHFFCFQWFNMGPQKMGIVTTFYYGLAVA